ncbi:cadherin domain-containing protein [Aquimarina hainanensis]|uniref:Cadherin domain-containing protein n=1 Tax=Aquimarina hainanensis TaxID=1578017 RepID=A0ABW5N8F9_9FLAO
MRKIKQLVIIAGAIVIFSCKKDDDQSISNTAPEIEAQSFNASEAAKDTDKFGQIVAADLEGDTLHFSLTENSNGLFAVSATGSLSLAAGKKLDYETAKSHSITVEVSDGEATSAAKMTINVIDVDENTAPVLTAQTFTASEDINGTTIIGVVVATDAEGDDLQYAIVSNEDDLFEISSTGELSLISGKQLDYETKATYTLTVSVSDGVLTISNDVTITISNVNEAPIWDDSSIIDDAAEDIDDTVVFAFIKATDPEGDALTFSLTNDANGLFEIGSTNGEISLAAGKSLDYETATSHTITVAVSDGVLSNSEDIRIDVIDVADTMIVSTLAGSSRGFADGTGANAQFYLPSGTAVDTQGNVYVTDTSNHRIRKITPDGTTTTFAGSTYGFADGTGTNARFADPYGITIDAQGNLYVTERRNHKIRKITPAGVVTTLAGSTQGFADDVGTDAQFSDPQGITIDSQGNLYVADRGNHKIRRITQGGVVTTLAGSTEGFADGTGANAQFGDPVGIAIDGLQTLYVADSGNNRIRKISISFQVGGNSTIGTVVVSTLAGSTRGASDGTGTNAQFSAPNGIAVDTQGDIYVADRNNHTIRKVTPTGEVTTLTGGPSGYVDGTTADARFSSPSGIAVDTQGNVYISDMGNDKIRKITM